MRINLKLKKITKIALLLYFFVFIGENFAGSINSNGVNFDKNFLIKENFDNSLEIIVNFNPGVVEPGQMLIFNFYGRVAEGMHIYSIYSQGDFGPEPTEIIIETPDLIQVNKMSESKTHKIVDEAFGVLLNVHQNDFWIRQKYKMPNSFKKGVYEVGGFIKYQVCDNLICSIPIKKRFTTTIKVI